MSSPVQQQPDLPPDQQQPSLLVPHHVLQHRHAPSMTFVSKNSTPSQDVQQLIDQMVPNHQINHTLPSTMQVPPTQQPLPQVQHQLFNGNNSKSHHQPPVTATANPSQHQMPSHPIQEMQQRGQHADTSFDGNHNENLVRNIYSYFIDLLPFD